MQTKIADFMLMDGKKLYYEVAGEGEPLVLGHAAFLDSGMWDGQWLEFSKHYRVIRYDMRGFGKSDPLELPTSRRQELYALLQHLGVESAHLVGCSLSGEVMLDLTLEHPEMVKSLVLVNGTPSGFEMQGEMPTDVAALMDATQQRDLPRISEMQMRVWIDGPFRQPNEVDAAVRQRAWEMTQMPVRNFTWVVADMQPVHPLTPPAVQRLHDVRVPTLVVVGELDDPELLRAANGMAAEMPDARKVVIKGAAHIPSMEKPAEFNRVVLDFLGEST